MNFGSRPKGRLAKFKASERFVTKMSTLIRETFKTSRLAEFCSQKELVNQTGHVVADWPLVILKELSDNILDACEEAGIAPGIDITISPAGSITVADNGPGIAASTVADILDYRSARQAAKPM
jgi:DNA topoisomerase VI subunit B